MAIKQSNVTLRNKIMAGVHKALQRLVEQRAAENGTLIVLVNGKPQAVPAKELLKKKS